MPTDKIASLAAACNERMFRAEENINRMNRRLLSIEQKLDDPNAESKQEIHMKLASEFNLRLD